MKHDSPSTAAGQGRKVAASGRLRIAFCTTHPIQYEAPILRLLAATPNVDIHAFFGTDMSIRGYLDGEFGVRVKWDTPLTAGYQHTFLSTDPKIQGIDFWQPAATGLVRAFRAFRPDVVVLTSYAGRFHLEALWAARKIGAKVVMRHEASDVAVARSRLKGWVRDLVLRRLYKEVDGFAVIGHEARKHLQRLGVPASKMDSAPYCVDTDFFSDQVVCWNRQRAKLREELGIGQQDVALVFSGKLIPKKDPLLLATALRLLAPSVLARIHLLVAGDGELRGEMERAIREVLNDRGHFFGFLNQSEIGRVYAAGDLLVLPSRSGAGETWGLVVNEAMQFGLGAVVSDGVGCAPDLVTDSTGVIFRSGSPAGAAAALQVGVTLIQDSTGQVPVAARRHIADFTAARAAEGVVRLARTVCECPDS